MWFRLGVPYHSWRISHAKHHAATSHLTRDQAYVPRDRAYLKIPEFDATKEELSGGSVTEEVKKELVEAIGDSPIGTFLGALEYLVSSQWSLPCATRPDHRRCRRLSVGLPTCSSTHRVSLDIHLGRLTVSDRQSFHGMEAHNLFTLVGRLQISTPMHQSSRLNRRCKSSSRISVFSFGPPLCATRSDGSDSLTYSKLTWSLTSGKLPPPFSISHLLCVSPTVGSTTGSS